MSFPRRRESSKNKYKYSKNLKITARFISLYAGFPPLLGMTSNHITTFVYNLVT
ncbi:hypothetical protein [Rickettsia sp. wq]|uniref:hypothetical protein n=1 Tax=Rickettsia sp. wq TaxID=1851203 RepID=UPI0015CF4153|nr:hypothetical protein [Rickettsia sp. wq]